MIYFTTFSRLQNIMSLIRIITVYKINSTSLPFINSLIINKHKSLFLWIINWNKTISRTQIKMIVYQPDLLIMFVLWKPIKRGSIFLHELLLILMTNFASERTINSRSYVLYWMGIKPSICRFCLTSFIKFEGFWWRFFLN